MCIRDSGTYASRRLFRTGERRSGSYHYQQSGEKSLVQAQANRLAEEKGEITRDMLCEITGRDAQAALGMQESAQAEGEEEAAVPDQAPPEGPGEEHP